MLETPTNMLECDVTCKSTGITYKIVGKITHSVGAALCKSFQCPWLVLSLSSIVHFGVCCFDNVFVMSQ